VTLLRTLSALQSDALGSPAKPALRGAPNQSKPLFQRDPASRRELEELAHHRAISHEILKNDREAGLPQQRLEGGPKIEFVRRSFATHSYYPMESGFHQQP
jgi:hypothetical protein